MSNTQQEMAERFARDTADHAITVLRDDGLYRHVRFKQPEHGWHYWFELVTWPGVLTINGDMGTFTFHRDDDMFDFFRGNPDRPSINAHYWSEKILGGTPSRQFDRDRVGKIMLDLAAEYQEQDIPGLVDAVKDWLQWTEFYDDSSAHAAVSEFQYMYPAPALSGVPRSRTFEFADTWEWDFNDYTPQFLWCCHAIVHGIASYDATKAATARLESVA